MCSQKINKQTSNISSDIVKVVTVDDLSGFSPRKVSKVAFSVYVRQLLQNWRQGTVGCKSRSQVNFSNKKPWKQKGTGRARAGSARSPLWRGGGVVFGPQPRVRTLKVSKNLRKGVLNTLLWESVEQQNLLCLNWMLQDQTPKTTLAHAVLKQAELLNYKLNIFLPVDDVLHYAAFVNLPNVQVLGFDEINAYTLASGDKCIVLKKDLEVFKQVVNSWI
jgi:large subunit ribosomal protein L4